MDNGGVVEELGKQKGKGMNLKCHGPFRAQNGLKSS